MSRRSSTATALVALLAAFAVACTGGTSPPSATPSPVPVKVAFLQDLTVPGASQLVTPSLLGLQLALERAAERNDLPVVPTVEAMDTEGDPDQQDELARQIADDPAFVAVVEGPFMQLSATSRATLGTAEIPVVSLSGSDTAPVGTAHDSWWRVVPRLSRSADSLASAILGSNVSAAGACVVGDGSAYSRALTVWLTRDLGPGSVAAVVTMPDEESADAAVDQIVQAGCPTVGWTGFAESAALLRTALTEADHASVSLIGSDALKADAFLITTDGAGDGTVLTCGCVDLAASTRPEAGRFIHDFQSANGSPPGAYAAEGWDVGGMLSRAFGDGASEREAVAAALASSPSYEGLANTYRFTETGELAPGAIRIHTFRAEGLRWVGMGPPEEDVSVPVGTPGYLSVASCRTGRPFVYREEGRLRGFDVELTSAIARRLGLTLAWIDRPCRAALAAVAAGTLDAVLAPSTEVRQGTPTSGVVLSQHIALVATAATTEGQRPLLDRLGHGDTVAVVRSPTAVAWARDILLPTGVRIRLVTRRDVAYARLGPGRFKALVDLEPAAWGAIERRPGLVVAQSIDTGEHDVLVAKGPDAVLVAALDQELGRILLSGRYALLFAKYFPGTPIPAETGA